MVSISPIIALIKWLAYFSLLPKKTRRSPKYALISIGIIHLNIVYQLALFKQRVFIRTTIFGAAFYLLRNWTLGLFYSGRSRYKANRLREYIPSASVSENFLRFLRGLDIKPINVNKR